MKCPECGFNQRAKSGVTCGKCRYEFTFNPKENENIKLTDGKFIFYIKTASQNGTAWFTKNQLYAVYSRQINGKYTVHTFLIYLIVGIFLVVVDYFWSTVLLSMIGLFFTFIGFVGILDLALLKKHKLGPEGFYRCLKKWKSEGKKNDHLLEEPSLHKKPPDWNEPDIYHYGVERILIVERDLLVDLFVLNGLHAEQRMLVISETGYPSYLIPIAHKLLDESPGLPLYLLHDATPYGTKMSERIQSGQFLPMKDNPVTDLGMFPSDFQNLKRTHSIDIKNQERSLPCDVLMLPFLSRGLTAAFNEGVSFNTLIEQEKQKGISHGSSDFG